SSRETVDCRINEMLEVLVLVPLLVVPLLLACNKSNPKPQQQQPQVTPSKSALPSPSPNQATPVKPTTQSSSLPRAKTVEQKDSKEAKAPEQKAEEPEHVKIQKWNAAIDAGLERPQKDDESVDDIKSNWDGKLEVKGGALPGQSARDGERTKKRDGKSEVKSPTKTDVDKTKTDV
ncbi:hypothetical protein PFISCL1PPCAC_927, partial [Pristionchus fissidentatus]